MWRVNIDWSFRLQPFCVAVAGVFFFICNMKKAIPYVVGMLVFGTATAILAKTQFSTKSLGTEECAITMDGGDPLATKMCYFDKPW